MHLLLSRTYLYFQVVYEIDPSMGTVEVSRHGDKDHFKSNLSMLVQWSPYSSEADLLQQVSYFHILAPLIKFNYMILCRHDLQWLACYIRILNDDCA